MIKLDFNLDVCCKQCENKIKLGITDKDFSSSREERSFGYETEYKYVKGKKCFVCGNKIIVGINIYEYPKNTLNHEEVFGEGYFKDDLLCQVRKIERES